MLRPPSLSAIPGFRDLSLLGRGGMAEVYRARRAADGPAVAVKVLTDASCRVRFGRERFERECRACLALEHPHIVRAHSTGEVDGRPYLVMELVPGGTAAGLVRRDGPLGLEAALRIAGQVAAALDFAHQRGYIHRDVKPSNILFDAAGAAKLADFGLARLQTDPSLTLAGTVLGTPHYLAPEQISGAREIDGRADIYSLGLTLYFLLAGEPPFNLPNLPAILTRHLTDEVSFAERPAASIPEPAQHLIRRMAAKSPARRQQSIEELMADFAWAAGEADHPTAAAEMPGRDFYALDEPASLATALTTASRGGRLALPEEPGWRRSLAAGEVLCYEDDEQDGIYWLVAGTVEVLRAGRRLMLTREPGAVLGEMAALRRTRRSATLRALTPTEIICVPIDDLPQALLKNPVLLRDMLSQMADRIDRTSQHLVESESVFETLVTRLRATLEDAGAGRLAAGELAPQVRTALDDACNLPRSR